MTKVIAALMVVGVLYAGWELFFYWERVQNDRETEQKAQSAVVNPQSLPGMPYTLEGALSAAQSQGTEALANFIKTYSADLKDPRKAWIQLDYCQMLSREDTEDAKKLFDEIKARTPHNSPVWPRIRQLEKTYD
jgi:hypothetical protein